MVDEVENCQIGPLIIFAKKKEKKKTWKLDPKMQICIYVTKIPPLVNTFKNISRHFFKRVG